MAGMGPAPKPPGTRARRNRVSTAATIKANPSLRVPRLPAHPEGGEWHEMVREWWKDIWKSPMAPEFDASDKHGLFVLALLHHDFWSTESPRTRAEIGAEIRLQGVRFGLSPIDRRRLQWEIERSEDAQQKGRRRRGVEQPAAATPQQDQNADARGVLRIAT